MPGARRGRHSRAWVAAFSVFSLLLLGASPALAADETPAETSVETVVPEAGSSEVVSETPQETAAPAPVVEEPPMPPTETPAPVPPAAPAPAPEPEQPSVASDGAAPASSALLATDSVPQPPYLRWVAVDETGASVNAAKFTVQGPRDDSVTDSKGEKQWLGAILATITDNTGQADYAGADLDPTAGAFLVKTLTADADAKVTKDVVADEHYRVRPAEAAGWLVGEAAAWVESAVVVTAETEPTTVMLVASPAAVQSSDTAKGADPLAGGSISPLAVGPEPPTGTAPYLYWDVKDTAGTLIGGASFQVARADSTGNFVLAVTTVTDCIAADVSGCGGLADQDPDAGEYQVFDLGSSGDTPVVTTGRYKLTAQTPPAGMRFPTIMPVSFTMNGSGADPAAGVWPTAGYPRYNFGTLQLTTVGPEPGVLGPYLFWTTKSNAGVLTGGSRYLLDGANSGGVFGQDQVLVDDCQALPCAGFDRDPDTGEFQVNHIGASQNVAIVLDTRYRLTPTTPLPAGWTWVSTAAKTIAGSGNTATWPSPARPNYNFENFALNPVANSGNMPIVVRSRVSVGVALATASGGNATGSVTTNLGADTGASDAVGTTFRLWTSLAGNITNAQRYSAGPQTPVTAPWATCTTTAVSPGACTITIPFASIAPNNGGTQGNQYWVVEEVAPSGTYSNPTLKIGAYTGPTTTMQIAGITTPVANSAGNVFMPGTAISSSSGVNTQLASSQLPTIGASGGQPTVTTNQAGSFGAVPNSVNNPKLVPRCDVPARVGIVLDQSASISASAWTDYRQSLVGGTVGSVTVPVSDSVLGTLRAAGAQVSVLGFGTTAPDISYSSGGSGTNGWLFPRSGSGQTLPVGVSVGQPTALPATDSTLQAIVPTSRPGGNENATNWHDALRLMASKNAAANYDLVLFITDGAPNYILGGSAPDSFNVSLRSMEAAIYAANALKKGDTRLVAVGVGAGISTGDQNLRAISGTVKYAGPGSGTSDYYQNASWGTDLRERLAAVVKNLTCSVSVEVSKSTISAANVTADNVANWRFTAGTSSADSPQPTLSTPLTKDSAATAAGNPKWDLKLQTPTQQATLTLTENGLVSGGSASMNGWTLESVVCTVGGVTAPVTADAAGMITLSGITIDTGSVYCKFTNREQPTTGSIRWQKVSNDTPAAHLAGSVWSVQGPFTGGGPTGSTPTISVPDCVAATPALCAGADKDERAGYLEVTELGLGKYRITETTPPPGFTAPTVPAFYEAELTAANAQAGVSFGPVVNVRTLGTVTWGKSDSAGTRLAGSEWELQGPLTGTPPAGGQTIVVVDCVSGSCASMNDKDNRPGYFSVTGLAWGNWTLTETRAPAGYALDSTPHNFSITAAATTYTFSNTFVNVEVPGPNLPLTGGLLGRDFFGMLGAGVFVFGLGTVAALQLRKRRREVA